MNSTASAQRGPDNNRKKDQFNQAYFGVGAGLDYGGIGIKGEFLPSRWLGIFAGLGYNFVEPAFNGGFSLKILPGKKVVPTVLAMYGYNAAIRIKSVYFGGPDVHRQSYYGFSAGAGADIHTGRKGNKITIALLVPFRNASFNRDYDRFKNAGYDFNPDILPLVFSVGCNFSFNNKGIKK